MENSIKREILEYRENSLNRKLVNILVEDKLTIYVNDNRIIEILCTLSCIEELIIGYLYSAGIIIRYSDIRKIYIEEDKLAKVYIKDNQYKQLKLKKLSNSAQNNFEVFQRHKYNNLSYINKKNFIKVNELLKAIDEFDSRSKLYNLTRGIHSCALYKGGECIIFQEDIGRHNAFDKVIGSAMKLNISFEDKYIYISGRITSDIVIKAIKSRTSIIITLSVPTDNAIKLAEEYRITIIGKAKNGSFIVYTCANRLKW